LRTLKRAGLRGDGVSDFVYCIEKIVELGDVNDYLSQRELSCLTKKMTPTAIEGIERINAAIPEKRSEVLRDHSLSGHAKSPAASLYDRVSTAISAVAGLGNAFSVAAGLGLAAAILFVYRDTILMLLADLFVLDQGESKLDFFFDVVFMVIIAVPFLALVFGAAVLSAWAVKMPFKFAGLVASKFELAATRLRLSKLSSHLDSEQKKIEEALERFKVNLAQLSSVD
jgi:hypothetical protein